MTTLVFLDSGPLGLVTHPRGTGEAKECAEWLIKCLAAGMKVCIPEVCDYEVRRELIRAAKPASVAKLDQLKATIDYVPLNTASMLEAAELWADARNKGHAAAPPEALDGDVILAAQARQSAVRGDKIVVATTNVGHLARYVPAKAWRDI